MKKLIRILIICSFLISVNGIAALAAPSDPPPLYLPVLHRSANTYLVTGTIKDVDQFPVSNATVRDATGKTTVTDLNGNYSLELPNGPNTLTATRSGFEIAPLGINVTGPLAAQDMTALAGCGNVMVNGALTTGLGGWNFPVADALGGHTTGGTDAAQFISAPTSGRTGILAGSGLETRVSNSRGVSQVYHIPSDVDMALLGLWVYQVRTSTSGDPQYVQILDQNDNVLENKPFPNLNNPVWTYYEFNLNPHIGKAIKVEVGTFNDGAGGVAAMYFDDVSLTICTTDLGSGGCANVILNGTMEATGGWAFTAPQTVPPAYSGAYFHAGAWSLQTGIPLGGAPPATTSFSEAFQVFNIPANANDVHLSFWYYTTSSVATASIPALLPEELNAPHGSYLPDIDQQYVYLNDGEDDQTVLFKLNAHNSGTWLHFTSDDINYYIGENVRLKFGTYNDTVAGVTAMYVDDVALEYCVALDAPAPDSLLAPVEVE